MHVVLVNEPVLLVVKVTVPVGVIAPAPEASLTVAVQFVVTPVLTDAGLQDTLVEEALIVEASVKVPLLPV